MRKGKGTRVAPSPAEERAVIRWLKKGRTFAWTAKHLGLSVYYTRLAAVHLGFKAPHGSPAYRWKPSSNTFFKAIEMLKTRSAREVARVLDIPYTTAWKLAVRLREYAKAQTYAQPSGELALVDYMVKKLFNGKVPKDSTTLIEAALLVTKGIVARNEPELPVNAQQWGNVKLKLEDAVQTLRESQTSWTM